MFRKTTYFIDTTKGPIHKTTIQIDWKGVKKFAIVLLLIVAWLICVVSLMGFATEKETVKVSCTNAGILVFQDMEDNYIAYVSLANAEQVEEIKSIKGLELDNSVEDFVYCVSEGRYFEIRLGLNGEKVFCHREDVIPPSNYNYELSSEELEQMLNNSSEETQYLYSELKKIFKTV